MQKITPFLWFDGKAEEAANFYVSIFKNSQLVSITRFGAAGPGPQGGFWQRRRADFAERCPGLGIVFRGHGRLG